ncbi:MAG: hypothetical protein WCY11_15940 [Novosphingobium sp.]
MRKMKMLSDQLGSPDGAHVVAYEKGCTYAVPDPLAEIFEKEGWAKEVADDAATETPARAERLNKEGAGDKPGKPALKSMNKTDLRAFAMSELSLDLPADMTKAAIVAAIERARAASQPAAAAS